MSWDLVRIYWPNAAMPFALALMPLVAFTEEWQPKSAHNSWVQVQTYEMATLPPRADFEQSRNPVVAPSASISLTTWIVETE
jgi:hypothetical protein